MASSFNIKYFQNQRLLLLALVLTAVWAFSSTESAVPIQITGEIGGDVTFPCPVDKDRILVFFYLQREQNFVNGYYVGKEVPTKPWENTRVDRIERTVDMFRLNISHSGEYQCHIQYKDGDKKTTTTSIHLSVTANYSKPTFTRYCVDDDSGFGCLVTCASHGGYPETKIMFNVNVSKNSSSQIWKVVNNSEVRNPATMMFDSSSTAYFNCSYGQVNPVSCSVGEITSDMFSVCTREEKSSTSYSSYVILAAAAVVCLLLAVPIFMVCFQHRHKNRQTGAAECKVNTCAEEVVFLNEISGKEAP